MQTFVVTTKIGIPRLFERIVSPKGSMTSSSSVVVVVTCERDRLASSSASSGSLYSRNLFSTEKQRETN